MIKFFRTIRQTLLRENKYSRYLLYAIGEIFLVVIGILIALQINNWNENRKRANQETILLHQLKDELINNYEDVYSDYQTLMMADRSHYIILDHLNERLPYSDTLCFHFDLLRIDDFTYPNHAIYDKLKQEGLDIISNDSIRYYLQVIYDDHFPRITKNTSYTRNIEEYFEDYYLRNFRLNTDTELTFNYKIPNDTIGGKIINGWDNLWPRFEYHQGKERIFTSGAVPIDYNALLDDSQYRMMLDRVDLFRYNKMVRFFRATETIKTLVENINKELAKK